MERVGGLPAGWPRPRRDYVPWVGSEEPVRKLPVPWITRVIGEDTEVANWLEFRPDASRAHTERLCQVCGDTMDGAIVLARAHRRREISGPGMHPRCAALAVKTCPHLRRVDVEEVAYLYDGPGVGYQDADIDEVYTDTHHVADEAVPLAADEVRWIAVYDPLGKRLRVGW